MNTDNLSLSIKLKWTPLTNEEQSVPIWKFPLLRNGIDTPVIYRHVAKVDDQIYTVYIGEGGSLNGPTGKPLVYQYSHGGHGSTRKRIREFFSESKDAHWTEILTCDFLEISKVRQRKALEGILDGYYYAQSLKLDVFITKRLVYLNQ